jgi:NAD(P)-dependent dehydrogenase (short-subunit alcohol dehydrogenase family)
MGVDLGYAGTSVIVTGGTRGIGKAVVRLLLDLGAQVLAVGSGQGTVDALRADIGDGFGDALRTVAQDMRAAECGERLVSDAVGTFGGIDLVVNNAAAFDYVPADAVERPDWQGLFTLKALGYWTLARAAVAELAKRRGAIVNVSGVAGVVASPASVHVGAVNAAVISMTEGMAKAFAGDGVRVNVVSPGATDTDRFATRAALLAERERTDLAGAREKLAGGIPVGHPVDPAEAALVIAMLGAPALRSLTGAHVVIDGGSTLGGRRRV